MERSRVEDIKRKFECLQNQSTPNNHVNKIPPSFHSSKRLTSQPSINTEIQNVRLSNASSLVGKGNIKRSHAFRGDKTISRNINTVNDGQPDLTETLSSDLCVQRLSSGNLSDTSNSSNELKTKKLLNESRSLKYPASKKHNVYNEGLASKSLGFTSPVSKNHKVDSNSVIDNDIRRVEHVTNVKKPIRDVYSTVFKTRKTPDLLSSVCDNLNLSERSANAISTSENSFVGIEASSVKSNKAGEQQKGNKKSLNEKLKFSNSSTNKSVDDQLTNTLKAALSAPLPSGPPPKKPPRTFAHISNSDVNSSNTVELKKQVVLKVNSASSVKHNGSDPMLNKPTRSKTESQIMLKKLENYLLNRQQNVSETHLKGGNSDLSKTLNMHKTNRAHEIKKSDKPGNELSTEKQSSFNDNRTFPKTNTSRFLLSLSNNNRNSQQTNDSSCFHSLNCTRQPVYDSPTMKQSNFFITMPRHSSVDHGLICNQSDFEKSSYGVIKRSASDEHIYAEPQDVKDEFNMSSKSNDEKIFNFNSATLSDRGRYINNLRPSLASTHSSILSNDLKPTDVKMLRKNYERSSCSKDSVDQDIVTQYGLHYMCTPIKDTAATFNSSLELQPSISDEFNYTVKPNNSFGEPSKGVNETINANVRLRTLPKNNLTNGQLSQLSVVADCTRPRQIRTTACIGDQSSDIDKLRIHQLLSEAYGKIRHKPERGTGISGSAGEMASGSDSDCSSVISSPDDPLHSTFLSQPLGAAANSVVPSIISNSAGGILMKTSKDREHITAERVGYVRRVSRRHTSIRRSPHLTPDRFSHLFECLLVVGLDLNSSRCKVPYIKTKFPENAPSPVGIENLCFPDAEDWPPSPNSGQSYIQILTDSNGVRKYSYCRRVQPEDAVICLPIVYCIITSFKSNSFYNKILVDLESRHGHQSETELIKFIEQLYECPFPAPGQTLSFPQHINSESLVDVYKRPLDSRQEDNELIQLLTTVKLSIFLQIFATLLHERKVILVSDSISKLSVCVEGLQSALYPFYWQHTVVPILPSVLMDVCEAPTPYLIGIIKPKLSDIPFNNIDLDLVVDIDDGLILNSKGDEGWILPSRLSRGLRSALQLSVNQASQSNNMNAANVLASEAIMRLFVELIGHYREHISLVSNDTKKREFQRETFIKSSQSRSIQLFLEWFTETAMFNGFIESRLERSIESRGLFEQSCSYYNEEHENSHLIMKNYKALNKTVKTLGDRFKAALS